jgi:hypothetical protein
MKKVDLYQIPLDDDWHEFELHGPIVCMGTQTSSWMNFWAVEDSAADPVTMSLRVFRTGETIPDESAVHAWTWDPWQGQVMVHLVQDLTV